MDGRDGLPGEPGLDGVPGRNGLDGIDGMDGIPGLPGSPGVPGTNGKDGVKGVAGDRGGRGQPGERGLPGPRGKKGSDGENGAAGKPGVSVWKVEGKAAETVLVPPAISGGPDGSELASEGGAQKIITMEGDYLKLTCAATGIPKPMISWNRMDGNAFPDGTWRSALKNLLSSYNRFNTGKGEVFTSTGCNKLPFRVKMLVTSWYITSFILFFILQTGYLSCRSECRGFNVKHNQD